MGLNFEEYLLHWDYYLSLEEELINTTKYVAFHDDNKNVYSIEFAKILQASSSEIDVLMKLLCEMVSDEKAENINKYRNIIKKNIKKLIKHKIHIDRYNLSYTPWDNWINGNENPDWWRSYNKVKHERNIFFNKATLKNTINSMGALYITLLYYYSYLNSLTLENTISKLNLEGKFSKNRKRILSSNTKS
jgi:hypothetical protein